MSPPKQWMDPAKMPPSFGAVVFRRGAEEREVLMIAGHGAWSFPKGRMEPGETPEETAVRELREETGYVVRILPGFSAAAPSGRPGEHRTITYFLGEIVGGTLRPDLTETAGCAWQPVSRVESILRFPQDREPFLKALEKAESLDKA